MAQKKYFYLDRDKETKKEIAELKERITKIEELLQILQGEKLEIDEELPERDCIEIDHCRNCGSEECGGCENDDNIGKEQE